MGLETKCLGLGWDSKQKVQDLDLTRDLRAKDLDLTRDLRAKDLDLTRDLRAET